MASPRQDLPDEIRRFPLSTAFLAAGVTFVVMLAMERLLHPLLFLRHPDRVLEHCGSAALIAFGTFVVLRCVKKPWN
jgi:uncharacterized membrane protein